MSPLSSALGRVRAELAYYRALAADSATPALSRWLLGLAIVYLVSPLDLIPDWIPVLGQLDDLVIVPLLVWAAVRSVPADVRLRVRAQVSAASAAGEC
ncbi:MAG: DUF1232 domain-containing protein [Gammaproteobacteria bacterium]|nr:DUF1232 domain-containing protein [Gammaproteobacteria bacterium]